MATTNKIVDTRRLAAKGRFGDTKIRNVRGKPSHVNAYEAYLMDTVGINPPASGKTINPKTRLPEYHGGWYTGHPLHHQTLGYILGAVTGLDPIQNIESGANLYESITGEDAVIGDTDITNLGEEIADFFRDEKRWTSSEDFAKEREAQDIMAGGLENLQTQYGQYMGEEGLLAREEGVREGKLISSATATGRKIKKTGDIQKSKFGGAYSGTIESGVEEAKELTKTTFDIGMRGSQLQAEKSEADFMAGLRKQMNQMLIDYQQATGEAYGSSDIFNQLNSLFDQYSDQSNV